MSEVRTPDGRMAHMVSRLEWRPGIVHIVADVEVAACRGTIALSWVEVDGVPVGAMTRYGSLSMALMMQREWPAWAATKDWPAREGAGHGVE